MALSVVFFAAVLFECAKLAFGWYVKAFPTYKLLYGALATIPLFLLWVYVSWMIFLLGAEVVNGLRYQQALRSQHPMSYLQIAYTALFAIWRSQQHKRALDFRQLLRTALPKCDINQLRWVLQKLCDRGFIIRHKGGMYTLLADCHALTLLDLQQQLNWTMPDAQVRKADSTSVSQQLKKQLTAQTKAFNEQKPKSLNQLFAELSKSTT